MKKNLVAAFILLLLILVAFFKLPPSSYQFNFKSFGLSDIVQSALQDKKGEYAVYIENLSTGEKYGFNEKLEFPSASLYKLYLLEAVLKEIENGPPAGGLKLEVKLTGSKTNLIERYGSIDSGYEDWPDKIEYSVEEGLQRIGRISDNFAAIMLTDKIGWNEYSSTTTALDIGLFFKNVSDEMIKYLSLNQINDRIPKYLPKDIKIVHKTGELSRVRHDAGIVYLTNETNKSNKAYIIVLMSKDLQFEDEGIETLAQISKEVYEYFKNKSGPTGN